jgi:streptogramin lyase
MQTSGVLTKLDTSSEALRTTTYEIPKIKPIYDTDTDSKGRTYLYGWREDKIGVFDPNTLKYSEYKTPTPMSGPRRGQIDAQDRLWAAEYWAGQLVMLDADKNVIKEYPLIPGAKPYTPPYASPYTVSVDDKNQIVWTTDFNTSRLYRIDMNTGQSTEYIMPSDYEIRDLRVDNAAARPTVWIPAYRPPSKLVKVQVR